MLRRMGVAAAVLLLAVCIFLPLDHQNVSSAQLWTQVDETVSLAIPADGIECFAVCKRPHNGTPYFCQAVPWEVGCALVGTYECYDVSTCNICEYPCN